MRRRGPASLLAAVALATGCQQAAQPQASTAVVAPPPVHVDAASAVDILPIVKPAYPPARSRRHAPRATLPDGTSVLFPGHRVVAFYGAAGSPTLGVLGTGSAESVWPALRRQAAPYPTRHAVVLPAYELITFVATRGRGDQGNYSARVPDAVIAQYARAAKRHHALLVLDIQPGRGDFLRDAMSLRRWLRLPYIGLGIDPEWKLYGGELPLSRIGHTDARAINHVSWWLDQLVRADRLPQKLLLVHEFTDDMVRDKPQLRVRKHVAMVFNVDGFGSRAAKIGKYRDFARADHRFPLGFKLFYDWDIDMLTPWDVLRLHPRPSVVEYE